MEKMNEASAEAQADRDAEEKFISEEQKDGKTN